MSIARLASVLGLSLACVLPGAPVDVRARANPSDDTPRVPPGFQIERIARIEAPRELAVSSGGDLLVGTQGSSVMLVPRATGTPGKPAIFATFPDRLAAGIALGPGALYVGTTGGIWRVPYRDGDRRASAAPREIARVRPQGGRGHETTSVAVAADRLYASVGSSCNACEESDPTRATILEMSLDGRDVRPRATHVRNAIALAVDPATQALWAGVAGQDELAHGHPYEIFDDVTAHDGTPDYGWPTCVENHRPVDGWRACTAQTVARVAFPAYETPIGAAFYHVRASAAHAFGTAYRDGAFVALHGSWHTPPVPPRVVFVPLERDAPTSAVDWNDPTKQWRSFVDGYQRSDGSRAGRPTGVAVAADGSLFVADDAADAIYRIRPARRR
ncbi:MAG: sorbosone dehydrogenase family protein [Vulcanimicrobiaceae bacterium]